jgi:molybdate transport system regulatory protein
MRIKFKIWIETDNGTPILGKGGVKLLRSVSETGSISEASKKIGVSYKFAWEYLKKINDLLGGIEMKKGGKGAGGTMLSDKVLKVLEIYEEAEREIQSMLEKYEKKLNEILENNQ